MAMPPGPPERWRRARGPCETSNVSCKSPQLLSKFAASPNPGPDSAAPLRRRSKASPLSVHSQAREPATASFRVLLSAHSVISPAKMVSERRHPSGACLLGILGRVRTRNGRIRAPRRGYPARRFLRRGRLRAGADHQEMIVTLFGKRSCRPLTALDFTPPGSRRECRLRGEAASSAYGARLTCATGSAGDIRRGAELVLAPCGSRFSLCADLVDECHERRCRPWRSGSMCQCRSSSRHWQTRAPPSGRDLPCSGGHGVCLPLRAFRCLARCRH